VTADGLVTVAYFLTLVLVWRWATRRRSRQWAAAGWLSAAAYWLERAFEVSVILALALLALLTLAVIR